MKSKLKQIKSKIKSVAQKLDIGDKDPVIIHPYIGYTSQDRIFCMARVLEDHGVKVEGGKNMLDNFIESMKRFETDEVPEATVEAHFHNQTFQLTSNEEGFITLDSPIIHEHDHEEQLEPIQFVLTDVGEKREIGREGIFQGKVLSPSTNATIGVISDIDDTILKTDVLSKVRMIYNSLFLDTKTRKAIDGSSELFNALYLGEKGERRNPIFYLSNSPWNIYDYLENFLYVNNFPQGPILLRDFGLKNTTLPEGEQSHKHYHIERIINAFPQLKFILIGDASEHDPDIYFSMRERFKDNIAAVFLRSIDHQDRMKAVNEWYSKLDDVDVHLFSKFKEVAEKCADYGFIARDNLKLVSENP